MAVDKDPRLNTGIRWLLTPSNRAFGIEVQRAPESTSTGSASTASSLYTRIARLQPGELELYDRRPRDNVYRYYRGRHWRSGYDPSTWSSWNKAKPGRADVGVSYRTATSEGRRRVDTFYQTDKSLATDVTQGGKVIARGYLSGQAQDADSIEFSPNFTNAPMVTLRGGISYEPRSTKWLTSTGGASTGYNSTKPQYDQLQALNLTSTGFTVRAKLRQKITAESTNGDDFSTGNALTSTGNTAACNLTPAGASDDQYTVHLSARVSVKPSTKYEPHASCQAKVQIRSNDGGGWVERQVVTYSAIAEGGSSQTETIPHDQRIVTVSGLGNNDDIDLLLKEINVQGAGATHAVSIHGFTSTDSASGVTYVTSTGGDIFASKTPDAGDTTTWEAFEVA